MAGMKPVLEHANVTVASIDEAKRFLGAAFPSFRERGGGSLHGDPERGRWVHFGTDDVYIALQENREHSPTSEETYTHDGFNHLGFVVDDLDELVERMEKAGYPLSPVSAMDSHPFRRRAYFDDGNGFEWEFVEYSSDKPAERNDYSR